MRMIRGRGIAARIAVAAVASAAVGLGILVVGIQVVGRQVFAELMKSHGGAADDAHQMFDASIGGVVAIAAAVAIDCLEGRAAVAGRHDSEAVAFEVRPDEADDLRVVVDDEDRP